MNSKIIIKIDIKKRKLNKSVAPENSNNKLRILLSEIILGSASKLINGPIASTLITSSNEETITRNWRIISLFFCLLESKMNKEFKDLSI